MKEGTLKPGDVVFLNGNRKIKMAVEKLSVSESFAHCVWFDVDGLLRKDVFDVRLLHQNIEEGFCA